MAALAHSHGDEPIDPAEAEMSEAAFEVIQRAHQLCDHPAARELTAEPDLEQRAGQARSDAQAILQDLAAESLIEAITPVFPPENSPPPTADEPVTDWKQAAQDAWSGETWAAEAVEYRTKRGARDRPGRRPWAGSHPTNHANAFAKVR